MGESALGSWTMQGLLPRAGQRRDGTGSASVVMIIVAEQEGRRVR